MSYSHSARWYDAIYSFKDYKKEVDYLLNLIREHCSSGGTRLLDVACGTGKHIEHLKEHFQVEGVDIEPEFLKIVRERHPDLPFHEGDMRDFDLDGKFDVITCMFSSIGYMKTPDDLRAAVANMGRHLLPGGILIIEPWFTPDKWRGNTTHMIAVDEPELKIARVTTSLTEGTLAIMEMHHLVGTPQETIHFMERHEMWLATNGDIIAAFEAAGLNVYYDPVGPTKRGIYIGIRG